MELFTWTGLLVNSSFGILTLFTHGYTYIHIMLILNTLSTHLVLFDVVFAVVIYI